MNKKLPLSFIGIAFACMAAAPAPATLNKTGFPTTITDVPRDIRNENLTAGYQPFKDASAYQPLEEIESEEDAFERISAELQAQYEIDKLTLSDAEYCHKYFDEERCEEDRNGYGYLIELASSNSSVTQHQSARNDSRNVAGRAATNTATRLISRAATSNTPQNEFANFWKPNSQPQTTKTQTTPNAPAARTNPAATPTANPAPTQSDSQIANDLSPTNNKKHNGKCHPSAISGHFTDKILTSGKYESIDPAFEKAMVQLFRVEGGCGSHKNDSGGYTCYGIASRYNPDINFKTLTRAKAEDIIFERYYRKQNSHLLPDTIRGDVFRLNFNAGSNTGTKRLQKILGLTQTGKVDENLINTIHEYKGNLHDAFWDSVRDFYVNNVAKNPKKKTFLKGWLHSVKLFRDNGCHVVPEKPLLR